MEFKWINKSKININEDQIEIFAPPQSDFFYNNGSINEEGITPESLCNAPFYYTELTGDFVMKAKVSHDFKDTYDSSSIMVMLDMKNWAKACTVTSRRPPAPPGVPFHFHQPLPLRLYALSQAAHSGRSSLTASAFLSLTVSTHGLYALLHICNTEVVQPFPHEHLDSELS